MKIISADFVCSYPRVSMCPTGGNAEFAFIGRSNVGKSSLINMLTNRKGLAKVSATPGKTQLINYFLINQKWHLVDLPGYGYAKVSKTQQVALSKMINGYLLKRKEIAMLFVLIDANISPPSKVDLQFIKDLGSKEVPYTFVFTKCDRLGETTLQNNVAAFMAEVAKISKIVPPYFLTSSERTRGRDEILDYIHQTIYSH
jgi:GTP-binding protein